MQFIKAFKLIKDISLAKIFNRRIPIRVKHNITFRCNLGCPFCLLKMEINKSDSFEMNTSQIKRMMKEFKEMGTRFWVFSGGEPLLREDLGELIDYAKDKMDFHCSIVTNGVLFTERIKDNPAFKRLDLVQISLDGPKEIQDKLRGAGTYDKIILALDILRKLRIKTVIMTLVLKDNINHLGHLIKLATQYNIDIAFQAIDVQPAAGPRLKEDFSPPKDGFKKVVEELIKEKKKNYSIFSSLEYLKMIKNFWPDVPHKIKCYAGQFYCEITPEGFVLLCCAKLELIDSKYNGLNVGFSKAFFQLGDMSGCRDCYYAGPQELNIILGTMPLRLIVLYKDYFCKKIF